MLANVYDVTFTRIFFFTIVIFICGTIIISSSNSIGIKCFSFQIDKI